VITLKPGEGIEYKLTMKAGGKVNFSWAAECGVVNYDATRRSATSRAAASPMTKGPSPPRARQT
jgi:hypothetical protein